MIPKVPCQDGNRPSSGATKRKCLIMVDKYKNSPVRASESEPVWPSGKALGWSAEGPRFDPLSALLSLQKLWFIDTVL